MKYVVEPGEFAVLIGRSATDIVGNAAFYVSCETTSDSCLLKLFTEETILHNISSYLGT